MTDLCLITGGAGFIGSNLARGALARGYRVRVLDDFSSGLRENLADVEDEVQIVEGDVRHFEACSEAVDGAAVVFHEAALVSVPQSVEDPAASFAINARGTFNVLEAAREAGVRRVVIASSAAAYGTDPALPKREIMPTLPASPYAADKVAAEQYAGMFYRTWGLETVALRYFNVFGPRQDPSNQYAGVIAAFASRMLRGKHPIIFGDGEQSRDFVFVEDIVRANLLAAEADAAAGQVVNIGTGGRTNLNEMVETFNEVLGTDFEPEYQPPRAGDVKHSQADISAARQLLGYEPGVDFAEGLGRTIDWYRWALETGYGGWAGR